MTVAVPRTVAAVGAALRGGRVTSIALVAEAFAVAERTRSTIDAMAELCPSANAEAAARDAELAAGHDRGPLHGVPVAVKETIDVAGVPARLGCPGLGHHVASRDATVVARLRAAGAVVVGTTRSHELAWGMVTPRCRNPRDPSRTTGGSSGGSAAAVAAGIVPIALGTDTGGSVRNPAALCGVVGVKLAHGALPLDGVAPLAPSQDCPGVLAGCVADAHAVLVALGALPARPAGAVRGRRLRVGVLSDAWAGRVEEPVAAAVATGIDGLRRDGIEVVPVAARSSELAPAVSYVTMLDESAREWWPQVRPGDVTPDVRRALALGTHVTPDDRALVARARAAVRGGADAASDGLDAVVLPACAVTAAPAGDGLVACAGRTVPIEAAHAALTAWASCTGRAAVSVPAAVRPGALPVGVQLVGGALAALLAVASRTESDAARPPGRGT